MELIVSLQVTLMRLNPGSTPAQPDGVDCAVSNVPGAAESMSWGSHVTRPCTLTAASARSAPAGAVRSFNRLGDYSYGTYIYSFPMQQCLVLALPGIGPWALIGASLLVSLPVAVASWHFIEKPAIARKRRPAAARQPSASTAA